MPTPEAPEDGLERRLAVVGLTRGLVLRKIAAIGHSLALSTDAPRAKAGGPCPCRCGCSREARRCLLFRFGCYKTRGMDLTRYPLAELADKVGTPFYCYDGAILRDRLARLRELTAGGGLQAISPPEATSRRSLRPIVFGSKATIEVSTASVDR